MMEIMKSCWQDIRIRSSIKTPRGYKYRGIGIGTTVMKTVISRLKELGVARITGSTVYKWNLPSQKMHQKLGFQCVKEDEKEYIHFGPCRK